MTSQLGIIVLKREIVCLYIVKDFLNYVHFTLLILWGGCTFCLIFTADYIEVPLFQEACSPTAVISLVD